MLGFLCASLRRTVQEAAGRERWFNRDFGLNWVTVRKSTLYPDIRMALYSDRSDNSNNKL